MSFLAAHTLGRCAAVAALWSAPPATESGLGVDTASSVRPLGGVAGITVGVAAVAVVGGWWVAPFLAAAAVGTAAVVALAVRKIGGLAGDVLGAIEQVVECLVLVVASGVAMRSSPWWT